MSNDHDLERFVDAQRSAYDDARHELKAGRKRTHWMWFVFPQIAGLGQSAMARHYAISSLDEANAYLAHPVLGPRLLELTHIVNALRDRTVDQIFGYPDDMKFHSSMTLFAQCDSNTEAFKEALDRYFQGQPDSATLDRLNLA